MMFIIYDDIPSHEISLKNMVSGQYNFDYISSTPKTLKNRKNFYGG